MPCPEPTRSPLPEKPPMIHVEEINDIRRLAEVRLLWNALLPKTRGATFFHSLDWLETYWSHFGHSLRLRVLVVSQDGRPVGILPLVVITETSRVGRIRTLTYPLHCWGSFYGPIGPDPTATLAAGLRHIRRTPRDYDLIDLRWVDNDRCDHGRTEAAMVRSGLAPQKRIWDRCAMIDMDGTWDEYWSGLKKKWRHNIDRLGRRLAEHGEVTYVRYRPEGAACGDDDPRWDLYDTCVELAQRSWQGSSTSGTTLSHEAVSDFLSDSHAAAARAGSLDLNLLLLAGRPIAFQYNYHYQGRVYALRKGYDPEFGPVRPGLVLKRRMLQDSFDRGDLCHNMGVDALDTKRPWQTSLVPSYRYTHFPIAVPRVQLLRIKRWVQDRLVSTAS